VVLVGLAVIISATFDTLVACTALPYLKTSMEEGKRKGTGHHETVCTRGQYLIDKRRCIPN
jgi:hypothetical protein